MSWSWIRLLIFTTVIALAGCGKLPRPFEPGARDAANPLLQLQDSKGVVVAPIYDAPADFSAPLAEMIAKNLRRQDIPATASGVLESGNLLEGWYVQENAHSGEIDLIIDWRLSDRSGAELLTHKSRRRVPIVALMDGSNRLIKQFAADIAPAVSRSMIGESVAMVDPSGKSLAIGLITGAPGDGNDALRRAFSAVLRRTEIAIVQKPDETSARLEGQVEVTPHTDKLDQVRLVWTIRDSDGKELAVMRQGNKVPKDRLRRRWGSLAFDIVLAMRKEIVETMRRLSDPGSRPLALPSALR